MFDKKERPIYYVSNLGTGKVSIIDGDSYRIIKEVEIGPRPHNIIVDEKNNVYIASDRNGKITLIHDLYDSKKIWYMPNNGNIQVDSIDKRIYVCDTEEVGIYNLGTGEKIGCITGFVAADCLRLDKDKKRLFVLDILQKEMKVYDTSDFHLIKLYKDFGIAPSFILLGEGEREVYIANKGRYKGDYTGNISILNLESGNISYIDFKKGSVITALEQNGNFIYAVNIGSHRIEVIDILERKSIAIIKTTLPELKRLRLSPDKKTLLATSGNIEGKGVVDIIDTSNNSILDTIIFEQKNSIPYDIGVVSQSIPQIEEDALILDYSEEKWQQKDENAILAQKVLSTYQEKINFPEVLIKVPSKEQVDLSIVNIVFHQCQMVKETRCRKVLENRKDYSLLQYEFYISYCIDLKDENEEKYVIEGRLKGRQKATLYIPDYAEQQGVRFVIKSFTNLTSTPVVINNKLKFDASVLISTRVVIEEIVFIPVCKECKYCNNKKEVK